MGTVIHDRPPSNHRSQPRWDRVERAALFEPYRQWRTQGLSERQAATALTVPRPTLPAWRMWHDSLARGPHGAAFLQSGPGLAFVHRLVMACHLGCVAGGACGMRWGGLWLPRTSLDRLVAASSGAHQQGNVHMARARVP